MTRTAADTDVRITPDWLWAAVREHAGTRSVCDVCTEPNNPLNADRYYTESMNGLEAKWATTLYDLRSTTYWGNVPFSRGQVLQWADKFVREARRGLECILLTQADVSTEWYAFIRDNADVRCHLSKRVQFLEPNGKGGYRPCKGGAKFGTQCAYFGPRRRRFTRVFGALGEILHGVGPSEEETT